MESKIRMVSAIICAYNEEKTIANVILTISESKLIDEIVVIDDGSTDSTDMQIWNLSKSIPIKYIHFNKNMGKGYAMAIGAKKATNEILLFIDADHKVKDLDCIQQILDPFLKEESKSLMVLGYTTIDFMGLSINPMKILTGERALLKSDIEPIINRMKESRFGVETLLYLYYKSEGKTMKFTHLKNLKHYTKYHKATFLRATRNYITEVLEISITAIRNSPLMIKYIRKTMCV
ncbi:MAG TPA: glycosyltransferase family 2 protein [Bacteroidales bacterium]|jgi:glycosyltransferase involved in cell wall biosynthesis|nr:glycosyltransferase family 2 protein [Bacteroidales bacterium]